VASDNPHPAWEMLPTMLLGASWLIAQMYLTVNTEEARAGKIIPPPPWLNTLQATFICSLALSRGLVVCADCLTRHWPNFFPLVYICLFAALVAPLWVWHLDKDKKLDWRKRSLLIPYGILVTFILALSFKKDDPVMSLHLWIIPIFILAVFLLIAWFVKRELRTQVITASWGIAALFVWLGATVWLASWIGK